jgi:hypothetical protein
MPIDKLDPSSRLLATLRAEANKRSERAGNKKTSRSESSEARDARDINVLRKELREVVKEVDINNIEQLNEVRPKMIRAVLLWEFGHKLRDHPEWRPMLDTIAQTLEASEEHKLQLVKLISELKR